MLIKLFVYLPIIIFNGHCYLCGSLSLDTVMCLILSNCRYDDSSFVVVLQSVSIPLFQIFFGFSVSIVFPHKCQNQLSLESGILIETLYYLQIHLGTTDIFNIVCLSIHEYSIEFQPFWQAFINQKFAVFTIQILKMFVNFIPKYFICRETLYIVFLLKVLILVPHCNNQNIFFVCSLACCII